MSKTDCQWVYCTAPDIEEARRIVQVLLQEELIACANIIPQIESHYVWDGQLQTSQEVAMLLKTTDDQSRAVADRIESLHSYECPAVLILDIDAGSKPFLSWIRDQVKA